MSLGGGSSSSTTSSTTVSTQSATDPEAARRMAAVAERQQAQAEEQWGLYKKSFMPLEETMAGANLDLVEPTRALTKEYLESNLRLLPQREQVTRDFMTQALEGVDKNRRVSEAVADVERSYKGLPARLSRTAAGMGVSPASGRMGSMLSGLGLNLARDRASAASTARRGAETESFSRLSAAQGLPFGGVDQNQGNFGLSNPADRATQIYQNVVAANQAGMRPLTQSSGSSQGSSFGWNANVGIFG